jgi:ABC-type transport system involved in multi-copper enzyme maturation permease subunit
MMQLWALIADSFRESRDRRLFWVLLGLSTLVAAALACIGYDGRNWTVFFGAVRMPAPPQAPDLAPARVLGGIIAYVLVDNYIGWIGTVLMLIATVGFFPRFMESGRIDVLLSKPIGRVRLFLGKYVGVLSFAFVQAAYFVLLTFLVLRLKSGVWVWGYLWAIPLLVAMFSYIYCVAVLFGMLTRSSLSALLLALLFWVVTAGVYTVEKRLTLQIREAPATAEQFEPIVRTLRPIRTVLPKTSDTPILVAQRVDAVKFHELRMLFPADAEGDQEEQLSPERLAAVDEVIREGVTPLRSVGSSLAFEAVVLALAGWIFVRRDF